MHRTSDHIAHRAIFPVGILFCVAITTCLAADPNADQAGPQPLTIVTLGDSITKGVRGGVTSEQTFASLLQSQLQQHNISARVINLGIGGERTDQGLNRIDEVVELNPDVVTVMYGTNDSYIDQGKTNSRITVDEYRDNMTKIVTQLLRQGIEPVLMTEPRWADEAQPDGSGNNPNQSLEPFVVACRNVASDWRLGLIDHFAHWTESHQNGIPLSKWTTDSCHPNPDGHQQIAALMLPIMRQMLGPDLRTRTRLLSGLPVRIVCFGDSVTGVYYHTGSRRAYTDMLGIGLNQIAKGADIQMINAGISGHTTADALARIDNDVLRHRPDLVTVMFGLNDITRVPIDQYRENLRRIVQRCRENDSEVILATPNNVVDTPGRQTDKLVRYCDVVRAIARDMNVPLCDCYRRFEAARAESESDWRLWMSDEIHPNLAGHQQIAAALGQTISRSQVSFENVLAHEPALERTLSRLREQQPIRILAMPPFDELVAEPIRQSYPSAALSIESWPVDGMSLAQIEQQAKARVRTMKPDLVLLNVPRSAASDSDQSFQKSYAWIMNWSLDFGSPTWDVVVIHPQVCDPTTQSEDRDPLIRKLVKAQDLHLIDRQSGDQNEPKVILGNWFKQQLSK